ncbi:3-beta hydroxysteroid dehydrogenase/isomerase [Raphidiopsis brookii D9]|nr:3-beta hydroxysteroid dehydrogenase/isomerase [Raphidiopsis brookii D9]
MKAIVTGGAGFIGSHLVVRLIDDGWDVIVVDNLSSGHERNIPGGAHFIWMDLTTEDSFSLLPDNGVDAIFHLASHVGQELSFENPTYDLKANALSTIFLLKWALAKRVPRFIFASTMNIYGDPLNLPVSEDSEIKPPSPYSVGKVASEYLCKIYQGFGIHTTCLRLFNVYGPLQDMKNMKQGMVSIFMSYVAKNVPIHVKGSKDRFRDFIYVDDVVDAFVKSLDNRASGKIYNVSTGTKTYVWELIDYILDAFGKKADEYPITFGDGTPKDQFGIYGDNSSLVGDLDWVPRTDLKSGLKVMADWVRTLPSEMLPNL